MGSRNVNSAECDHETAKLQVGVFASAIQNYEKLQIRMYIKKKKKKQLKNIRNLNASRPRLIYNVIEMKQYLVNLCKYHSRK